MSLTSGQPAETVEIEDFIHHAMRRPGREHGRNSDEHGRTGRKPNSPKHVGCHAWWRLLRLCRSALRQDASGRSSCHLREVFSSFHATRLRGTATSIQVKSIASQMMRVQSEAQPDLAGDCWGPLRASHKLPRLASVITPLMKQSDIQRHVKSQE